VKLDTGTKTQRPSHAACAKAIQLAILDAAQAHPSHTHIFIARAMLDAFGEDNAVEPADAIPGEIRKEQAARVQTSVYTRPVAADLARAMSTPRFAEPPPRSVWDSISPGMASLAMCLGVAGALWIMGVI
jgi:hypothetical protein